MHTVSRAWDLPRRTVRRWWQWLTARSAGFRFTLQARFADLGRAADDTAFWLICFTSRSLSNAMAILDHDGVRVP